MIKKDKHTIIKLITLCILPQIGLATPCPEWTETEAKKKIAQLASEIKHHDNQYFNHHNTEISDTEYDQLKNHLINLQNCYPNLKPHLSLHQRVRSDATWHQANMSSLNKVSEHNDIQKFLTKAGEQLILLQPKIDGIAIELVYDKGELLSASTRGDGKRGLNIVDHVQLIPAIPQQISLTDKVILHGELFARLDKMNNDLRGYTSARHFVSGHISRSEIDADAMTMLDFFPWLWVNTSYASDQESMAKLSTIGFPWTIRYTYKISSLKEIENLRKQFLHPSQPLPFLLDGIVIKLDSIAARKQWGESQTAPHWALAWKFPAQTAVTKVVDVTFTIGRSGNITPVLKVETVHIGRQAVSSVSLGSIETLHKKGIAIGDHIVIQLQGQATPTLNRVLIHSPEHRIPLLPDTDFYNSFSCLTLAERCKQQFLARLHWLVGRNGLDLPYLSNPALTKLTETTKISSLYHLFELSNEDLTKAGLDNSEISLLQESLKEAASLPFEQRIRAISLPGIGVKRAELLAKHYPDFKALKNTSVKELSHAINSSDAFASTLLSFLKLPEIRLLIDKLSRPDTKDPV